MAGELRFPSSAGELPAILQRPAKAHALFVLAHGAGAGMRHPFLAALAEALAAEGVATFRWQFAYLEKGSRRPDPPRVLEACARAAVAAGAAAAPDLPLFAGGKSMGGRITSQAAALEPMPGLHGIAFVGFPLHPADAPAVKRGEHLAQVPVPLLFLQGTRDKLADLSLLRPIVEKLPRATLHVIEDADHSFHVPKRSGRTDGEVIAELAQTIARWAAAGGGR